MIDFMQRPIPDGWQWVRLGDVCETSTGGTPSRGNSKYFGGDIPWVKSGELEDGLVLDTEEKISIDGMNNSNAKIFPKGTLLIALYGATVGRLGILGLDATTNQAVCAIFPKQDIADSRYLFYFLLGERPKLLEQSYGGAQPNISQTVVRDIFCPLPPLSEQRRIAAILTEQMAAVDKARAAVEEQLASAGRLPAAYLREVFENDEAKRWIVKKLGDICEIKLGKMLSPASKTKTRYRPYLRNVNVQWGYFDLSDVAEMDFSEKEEEKFSLEAGDLMICEGGEPGRAAVWNEQIKGCCYQKALHRLRAFDESINPAFIMYRMWYGATINEFDESNAKTTIAHLPAVRLAKLSIGLPDSDKQRIIVSHFAEKFAHTQQVKTQLTERLSMVEQLPTAILKRAFSGEL